MVRALLAEVLKGGLVCTIGAKPYKAAANPTRRPTAPNPPNLPHLRYAKPFIAQQRFRPLSSFSLTLLVLYLDFFSFIYFYFCEISLLKT